MSQRTEVRTQAEFDAAIARGDMAICISGSFTLRATPARAIIELRGSVRLTADYNSNSSVEAWENSSVVAWGNSSVEARGNSSVEARGNSSVEAWEGIRIETKAEAA